VFIGVGGGEASTLAKDFQTSPDVMAYRVNVQTGKIIR
jgi:hypothetical protein